MKYPNKCCQCGFCCLSETCPVGREFFQIEKHDPCPALEFTSDWSAWCSLAGKINLDVLGIGEGCCIKARAYKDGVEHDFASLPKALKMDAVKQHVFRRLETIIMED